MSDGSGKRPMTPRQRKGVTLLPVAMSLTTIGIVLTQMFDRDLTRYAGYVALGAGIVLLFAVIVILAGARKERS